MPDRRRRRFFVADRHFCNAPISRADKLVSRLMAQRECKLNGLEGTADAYFPVSSGSASTVPCCNSIYPSVRVHSPPFHAHCMVHMLCISLTIVVPHSFCLFVRLSICLFRSIYLFVVLVDRSCMRSALAEARKCPVSGSIKA